MHVLLQQVSSSALGLMDEESDVGRFVQRQEMPAERFCGIGRDSGKEGVEWALPMLNESGRRNGNLDTLKGLR